MFPILPVLALLLLQGSPSLTGTSSERLVRSIGVFAATHPRLAQLHQINEATVSEAARLAAEMLAAVVASDSTPPLPLLHDVTVATFVIAPSSPPGFGTAWTSRAGPAFA